MTLNNSSIMVPMTSTLRFLAITILFLVCVVEANSQDNKITKNGERKGDWLLLYGASNQLLDLIKEAPSIDKIAIQGNEVAELQNASFFEVVSYKSGKKNGDFQFYSARKNFKKYPLLATGSYLDGKIDGEVTYYLDNSTVPEKIFTVIYQNGTVVNQVVQVDTKPVKFTPNKWSRDQVELVKPFFRIEDGECVEQISTAMSGTRVVRISRKDNILKQYTYRNTGKELMPSLHNDGSTCLEYAEKHIEEGTGKWVFNGRYLVCYDTGIAFDTSSVYMESQTKEGVFHGECRYFDRDGNLVIEANYNGGNLDGVARIYNPKLKRAIVEANYKDGFLHGKYTTYYTTEGKNNSLVSPNCVKQHQQIWNQTYFFANATNRIMGEMIPIFKAKGYEILTSDFFKLYEAEYVEGVVQSIEYYHANGAVLYREVGSKCDESKGRTKTIDEIAAKLTEPAESFRGTWAWMDVDGKPFYTSEMESVAKQELAKTKECVACRRVVPTESAIFRFGDYRCFDKHGDSRYIFSMTPTYFCSLQCQMAHEEHECINNGFSYKKP